MRKIEIDQDGCPSQRYDHISGTLMFFDGDDFPSLLCGQTGPCITLPDAKRLVADLEKFDKDSRIKCASWDKRHKKGKRK